MGLKEAFMKCWCGVDLPDTRLHYPGNDPESGPAHLPQPSCPECGSEPHPGPCHDYDDDIPDQCWECGRWAEEGEKFVLATVDNDPGDAEVGPQPDIIDVPFCPGCVYTHGIKPKEGESCGSGCGPDGCSDCRK